MTYILALDEETTSSLAIVFDDKSRIVSVTQKEYTQIFPKSGWVEHCPHGIWESQRSTAIEVLSNAGLSSGDIAAIGITNQRDATFIWDKLLGKPFYNAIVWQDWGTSTFCDKFCLNHAETIREKAGLEVDAFFRASKINWLLENIQGARERAENGELLFGTVDSWLVWKLTNGAKHLTDVSNAPRTMLLNINSLEWDDE